MSTITTVCTRRRAGAAALHDALQAVSDTAPLAVPHHIAHDPPVDQLHRPAGA
ncbi:hypothetical protein [Streptomyces europaeiscabiei]|uniref:hypothetical protein n=1 Tax=Streptomyces europaeiscabiei TaxID=146819 RepID=UPI0029B545FF|nr:hypothetical protein [Streptomyces europaeiscabiei]MDX2766303.1 hypothetical protein [Streptomyces europaeiscabiei]